MHGGWNSEQKNIWQYVTIRLWRKAVPVRYYSGREKQKSWKSVYIRSFPRYPGFVKTGNEGIFTRYSQRISRNMPSCNLRKEEKQSSDEECRYRIELDYAEETEAEDVFLKLDYVGESLEFFIRWEEGRGSDFYTGQIWEIGLKRFGFPENVDITVHRLKRDMPVYLEQWPDLPEEGACRIHRLTAEAEYKLLF